MLYPLPNYMVFKGEQTYSDFTLEPEYHPFPAEMASNRKDVGDKHATA